MTPAAVVVLRPKIGTRKCSGTIIVPRDAPNVELKKGEEVFDEDDARAMSPRRNSDDLEKMSQEARAQLSQSVLPPFATPPSGPHRKSSAQSEEHFSLTRFFLFPQTRKTAR
jgi:hypothetical protein